MATGTINRAIFIDKTYTKAYTCAADSHISFSDADMGFSTPDGYVIVGVLAVWTGAGDCILRNFGAYGGNNSIRNISSTTRTATFGITIRYMKII